jgi:enterochelin esterase-like enzyme
MKNLNEIIRTACFRILQLTFLSGALIFSLKAQPRPMGPSQPVVVSPEISADNKVTFRVYSKEATSISVSGDFMAPGPGQMLIKNDTGLWSLTVGPIKPELYNYTFNVNGVRTIDPSNPLTVRDGNRYASTLLVPGAESDLYAVKNIPHGTLSKVWYNSPTLGLYRRMYVYTPAGYEDNSNKYPVFYLLHGGGGDEDAWTTMARACYIMDNLIAGGKAKPMIVVMTNGNPDQTAAVTDRPVTASAGSSQPLGMGSEQFPGSLVKDVIPYIEGHYRVLANNQNRALAGLSMGALQTQITSINNPDLFQYIGVFSIGLQMEFGDVTANLIKAYDANLKMLEKNGYKLFYIGCGKEDFVYEGVKLLRQKLDEHNFRYTYRETPGGHTWTNWRIYLSEFAPSLFK